MGTRGAPVRTSCPRGQGCSWVPRWGGFSQPPEAQVQWGWSPRPRKGTTRDVGLALLLPLLRPSVPGEREPLAGACACALCVSELVKLGRYPYPAICRVCVPECVFEGVNTHVWACWSDRVCAHICTEWCGRVCVSVYLWVYSVCVHSVFMHILACTNVCTHTQVTAAHSHPLACVCLGPFPCVPARGLRVCAHVACAWHV